MVLSALQILHQVFQNEEKAIRTRVREFVGGLFPDQVASLTAAYGLKPYRDMTKSPDAGRRDVVLIHGLDDPGKVWMNLAPRLDREGFRVWIMTYPNDQPITASARLFLEELEALKEKGIESFDVVAHSMGGLVTREMITHPGWAFEDRTRPRAVPRLSRFVMVGTPNHGSQLARFRLFSELRDQLVNILNRDYHWLTPIVDGAGEAGIDLLPGSRFIETLNRRPRPKGVDMLVIAGMISPWQVKDIERLIDSAQERLPSAADGSLEQIADRLTAMSNGVGDGLVTVDSARLKGVPLRIVSGSHISIIRNLTAQNPRVPPAIPIILDLLSQSPAGET